MKVNTASLTGTELPEVALALTSISTALDLISAPNPEIARLYLGNEFCDRLIANGNHLKPCISKIQKAGIPLSFVTPAVSDRMMKRLLPALDTLADKSEVIVNDWGVLRIINRNYPHLTPVAGRQLCKMIKDPRLPSRQWTDLYPPGIQGAQFHQLLNTFGIHRIELDVPPFVQPDFFNNPGVRQSVYVNQGFVSRGRICKIGCMHLDSASKFAAGHDCQQECMKLVGTMKRDTESQGSDLGTFQRGNTLFYKHSKDMDNSITTAVENGWVDRIIIMGDWHEDYRSN